MFSRQKKKKSNAVCLCVCVGGCACARAGHHIKWVCLLLLIVTTIMSSNLADEYFNKRDEQQRWVAMTTASNNSNNCFRQQQQQQKPQQQRQQPPATMAAAAAAAHLDSPWNDLAAIFESSVRLSRRSSWWKSNFCFPSTSTKSSGHYSPAEGVRRCCRTHHAAAATPTTQQSDWTRFICLSVSLIAARRESWAAWTGWCCASASSKHTLRVWELSFCLLPNNSCNVRSQIINKRFGGFLARGEEAQWFQIKVSREDRES